MEIHMKEHGFVTQVEYGELHISTDEQHGYRPYQLMVASIAGCSSGMLRKVLTKMRLSFTHIHTSVQLERNPDEANRIEKMHIHFVIQGGDLQQEKVEKAVALAHKNCGMVQTVKDSVHITQTFELV